MKESIVKICLLIALIILNIGIKANSLPKFSTLDAWNVLKDNKFVDLTHTFAPGIPHWHGFPNEKREIIYWYEKNSIEPKLGYGFYAELFSLVGQWGTHVDAPAHFAKGKRTLDQIKVSEMLLPLVVIDVHAKVKKNSDYVVTLDDIKSYERKYGKIPTKAFVALRTDWSKRWPDIRRMQNKDKMGISHYPGWSLDVLKFLYEKRKITASGQETLDTDPGIETSKNRYPLESYILGTDHYQIELLANLDEVPEYGALVVVAFPKPEKGAGFPARVFAIAP